MKTSGESKKKGRGGDFCPSPIYMKTRMTLRDKNLLPVKTKERLRSFISVL
jgi:hypothetical protein